MTDKETELMVFPARMPGQSDPSLATAEDMAPFLAASQGVQSDDAAMIARAGEITANCADPLAAASAIFHWVYKNVRKEMTVSLPSALDVLKQLKGDCNEHTYLFVGLARAAGIPAKIKVGLAYQDGAFYYHAWPAAFVGDWLEMDPTWGQETVDATHIALVEGDLADQLQLVKVMGQLQITVVEEL